MKPFAAVYQSNLEQKVPMDEGKLPLAIQLSESKSQTKASPTLPIEAIGFRWMEQPKPSR